MEAVAFKAPALLINQLVAVVKKINVVEVSSGPGDESIKDLMELAENQKSQLAALEQALADKCSVYDKLEQFFLQQDDDAEYKTSELIQMFNCTNGALSKAINKLEKQGKIMKKRNPKPRGSYYLVYKKGVNQKMFAQEYQRNFVGENHAQVNHQVQHTNGGLQEEADHPLKNAVSPIGAIVAPPLLNAAAAANAAMQEEAQQTTAAINVSNTEANRIVEAQALLQVAAATGNTTTVTSCSNDATQALVDAMDIIAEKTAATN